MSEQNNNLNSFLKGIADELRAKLGTEEKISPQNFKNIIHSLGSEQTQYTFEAVRELPDNANENTIYLVFDDGQQELPDISTIDRVNILPFLDMAQAGIEEGDNGEGTYKGDISKFSNNAITLFSLFGSNLGEMFFPEYMVFLINEDTLKETPLDGSEEPFGINGENAGFIHFPVSIGNFNISVIISSVFGIVKINNEVIKCWVYIYDRTDVKWRRILIPEILQGAKKLSFTEALDLTDYFTLSEVSTTQLISVTMNDNEGFTYSDSIETYSIIPETLSLSSYYSGISMTNDITTFFGCTESLESIGKNI